jgi:hypothetical protein
VTGMTQRRVLYLLTAVAMVGLTAGFVLAAGLTSTTVTQTASLYSVSTSAVPAFPTSPNISVSATPASVSSCSSSSVALTNGGSVNLYLGASGSVTCTTGDFAEEFTATSTATAAAGSYTFTIYTSYGSGPTTGSASGTVTIASTLSSAGTVNVYVDYGSSSPPAAGVSALSLVIQ